MPPEKVVQFFRQWARRLDGQRNPEQREATPFLPNKK